MFSLVLHVFHIFPTTGLKLVVHFQWCQRSVCSRNCKWFSCNYSSIRCVSRFSEFCWKPLVFTIQADIRFLACDTMSGCAEGLTIWCWVESIIWTLNRLSLKRFMARLTAGTLQVPQQSQHSESLLGPFFVLMTSVHRRVQGWQDPPGLSQRSNSPPGVICVKNTPEGLLRGSSISCRDGRGQKTLQLERGVVTDKEWWAQKSKNKPERPSLSPTTL